MKKYLTAIILLLAAASVLADNYITTGVNDTLRVPPPAIGQSFTVPLRAHFDARLDYWRIRVDAPAGMTFLGAMPAQGMTVHYTDSQGADTTYSAQIGYGQHLGDSVVLSSHISVPGYWDYNHDGVFEPYGTVKWEAGDYDPLLNLFYSISWGFTGGTMSISGVFASGNDTRGGTIDGYVHFQRTITVIVAYMRGDVNGDGYININDVTALVNYLLTDEGLDQYQLEAADFNQDGYVNINDVTAIQAYLANSPQGMEPDGTSPE